MARRVFHSFYYKEDSIRAAQVRNIGAIEGNEPASPNEWEEVKAGGDPAIAKWIAGQLVGRTCTVVLVGENTAGRKWINHEIIESWKKNMGVVGVCIHNLKSFDKQSSKGRNPFDDLRFGDKSFSSIVKLHDPPYSDSRQVYAHIADNMARWIEEGIAIRKQY